MSGDNLGISNQFNQFDRIKPFESFANFTNRASYFTKQQKHDFAQQARLFFQEHAYCDIPVVVPEEFSERFAKVDLNVLLESLDLPHLEKMRVLNAIEKATKNRYLPDQGFPYVTSVAIEPHDAVPNYVWDPERPYESIARFSARFCLLNPKEQGSLYLTIRDFFITKACEDKRVPIPDRFVGRFARADLEFLGSYQKDNRLERHRLIAAIQHVSGKRFDFLPKEDRIFRTVISDDVKGPVAQTSFGWLPRFFVKGSQLPYKSDKENGHYDEIPINLEGINPRLSVTIQELLYSPVEHNSEDVSEHKIDSLLELLVFADKHSMQFLASEIGECLTRMLKNSAQGKNVATMIAAALVRQEVAAALNKLVMPSLHPDLDQLSDEACIASLKFNLKVDISDDELTENVRDLLTTLSPGLIRSLNTLERYQYLHEMHIEFNAPVLNVASFREPLKDKQFRLRDAFDRWTIHIFSEAAMPKLFKVVMENLTEFLTMKYTPRMRVEALLQGVRKTGISPYEALFARMLDFGPNAKQPLTMEALVSQYHDGVQSLIDLPIRLPHLLALRTIFKSYSFAAFFARTGYRDVHELVLNWLEAYFEGLEIEAEIATLIEELNNDKRPAPEELEAVADFLDEWRKLNDSTTFKFINEPENIAAYHDKIKRVLKELAMERNPSQQRKAVQMHNFHRGPEVLSTPLIAMHNELQQCYDAKTNFKRKFPQ